MQYDQDIAKRFTEFRIMYIAKTQSQAAEKLKCQQSKISLIEAAKQSIDFDLIATMIRYYKLNAEWMATGLGSPKLDKVVKANLITDLQSFKQDLLAMQGLIKMMKANQTYTIKLVKKLQDEIDRMHLAEK